MEGNVTKTAPYNHVSATDLEQSLGSFLGKIQQTPPIFSAIKKDGKKLYQQARKGVTVDQIKIEPREVEIFRFNLLKHDIPRFHVDVECGGGTYIRSLIRDVGYKLGSVATTTFLMRTQQGPFGLEECIELDDCTPESIYAAIDQNNEIQDQNEK